MIYQIALLIFIGGLFIGGWFTLWICEKLAKKHRELLRNMYEENP